MKKTTLLKKMILDDEILVMPGAYDALSAKIIEKAGFKAIQCTGYGIAASVLGKPDVGILTMTEMLNQTRNICNAVDIPVMADGDTGFGNAINVYHTVKAFEAAGAAGINLEDQVFPKRCGHMDGKEVIPMEEMIKKIKAAVDAKKDKDFVINARTDAIAVYGIEEAIRRGNAYAEAGADLIFVEAPQSIEDIKYIIKNIKAPVSINMTDGGKTPIATIKQLQEWGAARVSIPVTAIFAAAKGIEKAMQIIMEEGVSPTVNHPEMVMTFKEFTDLVGLPEINELEKKYK
ncbi:MAG: methylisocitrate lyase [Thermosediminibacterales bacterium]|nr:methylisocitrate lyase [Thermosediminibacterales bacterium]MDK2836377.1 methylisocitrate lyase [Thermosediminibacterales bacterium]